jgi:hypothetical protein
MEAAILLMPNGVAYIRLFNTLSPIGSGKPKAEWPN